FVTHAGQASYRFLDDWPLRLPCLTRRELSSTLEIEFKPATILTPLNRGVWPSSLELTFEIVTEVDAPPPSPPASPPVCKLYAHIIQQAFIAYYERNAAAIDSARSRAGPGGLPTLAFANAVRNAFAHGGVIHFTPAKAGVTVSWGGLSY